MIYAFAGFQLDTRLLELRRDGRPIPIVPRAFDLLRLLIERRDQLVRKDELIETVWSGRVVSDATIGSCVNAARRAVGDDGKRQEIIRTAPRRGFRFVAPVILVGDGRSPAVPGEPRAGKPVVDSSSLRDSSALAVLPFASLGENARLVNFTAGLTRDVVTALWRWRSFPVIVAGSDARRDVSLADIRRLGEALGARYVLDGSVRRASGRIRVTVQLIDADTGHHILAERIELRLGKLLALQDEITRRITALVAPSVERLEISRLQTHRPLRVDASYLVRCGIAALDEYTQRDNLRARALFAEALELDPSNSRAHSGMALAYTRALMSGYESSREAATGEAIACAHRALAYDGRDAFAHNTLGIAYLWARRNEDAIASLHTAVRLNPSYGHAQASLGDTFVRIGRTDEGIALMEGALRLNPDALNIRHFNAFLARAFIASGRHEVGLAWAKRAVDLKSDLAHAYCLVAVSLGHLGRTEEASAALDQCRREQPDFFDSAVELSPFVDPAANQHILDGLQRAGWNG